MTDALSNGANASSTGDKVVKSPWHENAPDRPKKSVTEAWKQQFALMSALSENRPVEEKDGDEEGKTVQEPKTGLLTVKVQQLIDDGSLDKALDHLAAKHGDTTKNKSFDSGIILKVAQLFCIMADSVYMRDLKVEQKVYDEMKTFQCSVDTSMRVQKKLDPSAKDKMESLYKEMDGITQKIDEVAKTMRLNYIPLCNFSSHGTITNNGPYCGAFYRKPQGKDNGIIVVAFKGTGLLKEWFTDFQIELVSTEKSPVNGKCHAGFFNGIFSNFPSDISVDQTVGETIPFELLKTQLMRLISQEMTGAKGPVPIWITGHSLGGAYATHCWQGLMASPLDPSQENMVIRDLFTFGSPRVGNEDYARYPLIIKSVQNSWRFVNNGDRVASIPKIGYRHVDRKVEISPQKIELGRKKYDKPEGAIGKLIGHILGVPQHSLEYYWVSLREGAKAAKPRWEETLREEIRPRVSNLATWYLGEYHQAKDVASEKHADAYPAEESVLVDKDRRLRVYPHQFKEGASYRAVVKIQSRFPPQYGGSQPTWTMGTGWLIREDLVVTAGHNVFSHSYGGHAECIKCWIGYKGRKSASTDGVQHRKALNVVTTSAWYKAPDRQHDVALLQVSSPFDGDVNPFRFIKTATKTTKQQLTIVGYPGDKQIEDENGDEDPGAEMYYHTAPTSFNLDESGGMIKYNIDTYGGQSGAPILLDTEDGLVGIGTHCYGAGGSNRRNSGNAIGGKYGNDYELFKKCLLASVPENPTPIGTWIPNTSGDTGSDSDSDVEGLPEGEESFWSVFNTVAKIGSVALPTAEAFLGPAGMLLGTVAGGVLGSLANSQDQTESQKTTEDVEKIRDLCVERAQVAEAVLQSVIRLGHSPRSRKLFAKMAKIWERSYSKEIPKLVDFITPALTEYGFLITADQWERNFEANPEERKLRQDRKGKLELGSPTEDALEHENVQRKNVQFVQALFRGETRLLEDNKRLFEESTRFLEDTKPKKDEEDEENEGDEGDKGDGKDDEPTGSEESFVAWFKPLIQKAILVAKPLATDVAKSTFKAIVAKITKSSAESHSSEDKPKEAFENVICRALMADCALQAIEKMKERKLRELKLTPADSGQEEGIIDSIKTRIQKLGPVALGYAKHTVRKYLPLLLEQLMKADKPAKGAAAYRKSLKQATSTSLPPGAISMFSFPPSSTVPRLYGDDDNPDAPPIEPRPPASPKH